MCSCLAAKFYLNVTNLLTLFQLLIQINIIITVVDIIDLLTSNGEFGVRLKMKYM